jgi:hypothetical protein
MNAPNCNLTGGDVEPSRRFAELGIEGKVVHAAGYSGSRLIPVRPTGRLSLDAHRKEYEVCLPQQVSPVRLRASAQSYRGHADEIRALGRPPDPTPLIAEAIR